MTHGCLISKLYYVEVTISGLKRLNFQKQHGSPRCSTYQETLSNIYSTQLLIPYQQTLITSDDETYLTLNVSCAHITRHCYTLLTTVPPC